MLTTEEVVAIHNNVLQKSIFRMLQKKNLVLQLIKLVQKVASKTRRLLYNMDVIKNEEEMNEII